MDFIRKELRKTGFQLESKVASVFHEMENCEVEPHYYFTDWQTGDSRELDLKITYQITQPPILIECVLLIECKQLPGNAWTFIRGRGDKILFREATSIWDNVGKLGRQEPLVKILKPLFKLNDLRCDTYSHRYKEVILDPEKSNKRVDNIRSSEIKLAKAMYFERKRSQRLGSVLGETRREIDHVRIYCPLIVFEGEMLEATMLPKVDLRPISSAHLRHFSIQKGDEIDMVIDIVKMDDLKEFVRNKFVAEANEVKDKETEFRESYLTLIKRIKLKKRIVSSLERLTRFVQ